MKAEMAVNISGTVLASLFYDNSSSNGDQTGFLIGEVVRHVKDTISDSQINNVEVKIKIYVFDCIPCPRDKLFHDSKGEIQHQAVIDLLSDKHKNVIGWYCFRRNSTLQPSFRERLLHSNLSKQLAQDEDMFLFLLCSTRSSTNKSTHTFDHCFLHVNNNVFKKVPVEIINLGDTSRAEYRSASSHTVGSKHGTFRQIIHHQQAEFLNTNGQMEVGRIQALNGAITRQLHQISKAVIDSEGRCSDLELEVSKYRKRAKLKIVEKQQQANPPVTKGPSVDDILSMDQEENLPSEMLFIGHGHSEQAKGVSGGCTVKLGALFNKESKIETGRKLIDDVDSSVEQNKPLKVKLTSPINLHTRSTSLHVDTDSNASQSPVMSPVMSPEIRTRSKSGDVNIDIEDEPTIRNGKSADPFAFVGSIMAESTKKDNHKLQSSRKLKLNKTTEHDHDSDVIMETDDPVLCKTFPQKKSKSNTSASIPAACTLNQSSRTTRGQKLKGQGIITKIKGHEIDSSLAESNKDELNHVFENKTKMHKGSGKSCGREQIEILTDDSSSSQDTYEMDVSSSPVY